MKSVLSVFVILGSSSNVLAAAVRFNCAGGTFVSALPTCNAANRGLQCELPDGPSTKIYKCGDTGWKLIVKSKSPEPAPVE